MVQLGQTSLKLDTSTADEKQINQFQISDATLIEGIPGATH